MDDGKLLDVLHEAADAVAAALAELGDWGPSGARPGQYRSDVVADHAAREVLHGAGVAVMSEESGRSGAEGPILVVLDPLDGSTNAWHRIPWYGTSLCALDPDGARAAVVVNLASGTRYEALRGGGARRDGARIRPSSCGEMAHAIVGLAGFPSRHLGWAQFRALGASSLEMCAVAEGMLDGFVVPDEYRIFGWDYLGGMLVCTEAGAVVAERDQADLVTRDGSPRKPVAAATPQLLDDILTASR